MKPGLLVSSIPLCKYNRHKGASRELFRAIGCFEPTFSEALQALNMIRKVRSLKSQISTHLFLEEIITSSKEVLKDLQSDMALRIQQLGNSTLKTAESKVTLEQSAGF